jgi:predicted GTPase
MTLKRAQPSDIRDELFLEMGRPYVSTPPDEEDDVVFDPGDERSEDEDVRMEDGTALSYVGKSLAESKRKLAHPTSIRNKNVVIAIMGVTGAGKSTFISQLTNEEVEVGHHLESCM